MADYCITRVWARNWIGAGTPYHLWLVSRDGRIFAVITDDQDSADKVTAAGYDPNLAVDLEVSMREFRRLERGPARMRNPSNDRGLVAMQELLAVLRAAYMTYRTEHWSVHGDDYYGNHLMLQRIYEETEKHVDATGERIVGYWGPEAVDQAKQSKRVEHWMRDFEHKDPLRGSLKAAKAIQKQIDTAYRTLDKEGDLSLGLDDFLMAMSNDKDTHVYLLEQALRPRSQARRLSNP